MKTVVQSYLKLIIMLSVINLKSGLYPFVVQRAQEANIHNLHDALLNKNMPKMRLLFAQGTSIHLTDLNAYFPLYYTILLNNTELVHDMLGCLTNSNMAAYCTLTAALYSTALEGNKQII